MRGMMRLAIMGVPGAQGGASLLPFSDDFDRADGDLGGKWEYTPGVWAISGGKVTASPTLRPNLKANGDMETGNPPEGYTGKNGAVLTGVADERTGGAGVQSLNVARGTNDDAISIAATATAKRFYKLGVWWKQAAGTGGVGAQLGFSWWKETPADWTHRQAIQYRDITTIGASYYIYGAGAEVRFDDVSVQQLTTAELFCSVDVGTPNVRASVDISALGTDSPVGIVLALDSAANPQNYILVLATPYYNGSWFPWVYVHKVVDGTITQVANLVLWGSAPKLSAELADTTVRVFLDDVQIGMDYSVTDAGIVSNTRHGLFNADAANTLDNFEIEAAHGYLLDGSSSAIFTSVTAAADLWTGTAPLDHLGFPGMADLGTHWIASYSVREGHQVPGDGKYRPLRFTDDEGATWTAENTYLDGNPVTGLVDGDTASCYLIMAPNGDLLFFQDDTGNTFVDDIYRSSDGGKTWTHVASGIPNPELRMPAGYGCVRDGVIYVPLHKFTNAALSKPWDQEVWASDDNGVTWELQGTVPYAPGTSGDEFSVMVTTGNNMIAVCRDAAKATTYWNKSSDLGATWSAREELSYMGIVQMARMRRYAGGTLLFGREGESTVTSIRPVIWYLPDGGSEWCRKFYPTTSVTNDGHYCDVLQRDDGNFYFMTYAGSTAIATIQDAVFGISS